MAAENSGTAGISARLTGTAAPAARQPKLGRGGHARRRLQQLANARRVEAGDVGGDVCQPDGQPLTASMTEHRLSRAVGRAGLSREQGRITWHDLRHTYGSHLAMRGVPLKVIQELMGHATIEDCWALNGEEYGT
jgi:integrase